MKIYWETLLFFLFFFCMIATGIILMSQGATFARWNEDMPINHFIDMHAFLLSLSGIGILAASFWCVRLHSRLSNLEKVISDKQPRIEVE